MNNYYDYGTTLPATSSTSSDLLVSFIPLIVLGVLLLVFAIYYIFAYVMQAISLQTIARRRGIANPWLAWIPYATNWILGAIVRDYDKRNGINRRWDKILLIMSIALEVFSIVTIVGMYAVFIAIALLSAVFLSSAEILSIILVVLVIVIYALYILLIVFASAFSTIVTVCVFKLFESTVQDKALKYFLIYLLVPFAAPICLFMCRNKGYEVTNNDVAEEQISSDSEDIEQIGIEETTVQ